MAVETLDDLLLSELKDLYSAEKQAVRVYPRLSKAIDSDELTEALKAHLEQTKGQVERLDQVFETLEKRAGGKTCEAMKGLIDEALEILEEGDQGPVRDAALIGAAQRIEHYEIAAYGTVIALAKALEQKEIVNLLTETLNEEKQIDVQLTSVAEVVNQSALENSGKEEDDEEQPSAKKNAAKKGTQKK